MSVLAVDYGGRRTGIAVSDDLGITAQGLPTVETKDETLLPGLIAEVARERGANRIVVGLPRNMDGSEGDACKKVRAFGEALETLTGLRVIYWDERLTSVEAQRIMQEMGTSTRGRKGHVDRIAATLILEGYLQTAEGSIR